MKYLLWFTCILSLFSCKNLLLNAGFQAMGIYDDTAKYHTATSTSKEIVLLPTHHLGTPDYYDDLRNKIDSLSSLGYFFYTESVNAKTTSDTLLRKFRKFTGNPVSGYKNIVDSILGKKFKVKLKKKLIDQPSYSNLGVPLLQSRNVDATLEELIDYFESNYGQIILEPCDFDTAITEESTCDQSKTPTKIKNDVIERFRNEIVLKQIDTGEHDKIVIIYGDAHTSGILEGLKFRGFKVNEE